MILPSLCVKSRTCVNGCASACSAAKRSPQNPPNSRLLLPCSQRISRRNSHPVQCPTQAGLNPKSQPHLRAQLHFSQSLDPFAGCVPAPKDQPSEQQPSEAEPANPADCSQQFHRPRPSSSWWAGTRWPRARAGGCPCLYPRRRQGINPGNTSGCGRGGVGGRG